MMCTSFEQNIICYSSKCGHLTNRIFCTLGAFKTIPKIVGKPNRQDCTPPKKSCSMKCKKQNIKEKLHYYMFCL